MLQTKNRKKYILGQKNKKGANKTPNAQTNTGFGLVGTKPKDYDYPTIQSVPPGEYIAEIDKAEFSDTKKGTPTLVVSYTIEACEPNTGQKHYIKQSYPQNSKPLERFNVAMTNALNLEEGEEYLPKDCVGVREFVTLSYKNEDSLGGFSKRTPIRDETIAEDDTYNSTTPEDSSYDTVAPPNIRLNPSDEIPDEYDDDSEFDDFLEDDIDE